MKVTHEGWYGICPCWFNLDTDILIMTEKHWVFAPLMWFSDVMFDIMFLMMPYHEDGWPALVREVEPFHLVTSFDDALPDVAK